MKFSVVIPSYNGEAYIEETLLSVLRQTRRADEIIVSDDRSSDRTLEICEKYRGEGVRIYVNEEGPSGFVNGWNKAIARAEGEYISVLHQDDLLMPSFLEEAERALDACPGARHLFTPCHYIDGKGRMLRERDAFPGEVKVYSGREYVLLYRDTPGHIHRCPGVITHRSVFDTCRYRAEAGHIADNDFFYRVAKITDVVGIMKPLACYREHAGSETGHLEDRLLNRRLVRDYEFQIRQLQPDDPDYASDLDYFRRNRRHHAKRLVGAALRQWNLRDLLYGLRHF